MNALGAVDPFAQARQYLARVVPWPNLGEQTAYINIHTTFVSANYTKPVWGGIACSSVNEAIGVIQSALKKPDTRDIYVCMSSQALCEERVSPKGFKWKKAVRSGEHAVALKSLFLDIDCKGEGYGSLEEAAKALKDFITATNLPRPSLLVGSGGGLHVYWVLAQVLSPEQWRPMAFALAESTKRHGFKCDTQCTIDSARVLRVPCTLNHKGDAPKPVRIVGTPTDFDYSVERIWKALEPYKVEAPAAAGPVSFLENAAAFAAGPSKKFAGIATNDLSAGIDSGRAPINLDDAARECPFINDAIATGGASYGNPLWNLTTLLATFTAGGRADAHRMADKHPGYTQASTDDLFDRKTKEKDAKNLGWPSCSSISGSGCKACQSCPHLAAAKSPLNFAKPPAPITPVQLAQLLPSQVTVGNMFLPKGFVVDPNGIICEIVADKDDPSQTKPLPVTTYPVADPWLQSGDSSDILNFTSTIHNRPRAIRVPLEDIGGFNMRKILQGQGFMLPAGKGGMERTGRFFVGWIQELQRSKDLVSTAEFGWVVGNGKTKGFVYGGRNWQPAKDEPAPVGDVTLSRMYHPVGDIAAWRDALKLVTGMNRPDLEVITAAAFAAPLIRFTGHTGMTMSAFSQESGAGKSTALLIGQAVWGDPIRGRNTLNDTYNFTMGKMGRLKSLPIYWDEVKTEDQTKKFLDIGYEVTLGKEKGRSTRSAGLRDSGTWSTILTCCTNDSLLGYVMNNSVMTTAGIYRIFEFEVRKGKETDPGMIDGTVAQRVVSRLNENYGNAGLEYAKFLGANYSRCDAELGVTLESLSKEVRMQQDERFWVSLIAVLLQGAVYANELGLTDFHVDDMKEFLLQTLDKLRQRRGRTHVDMTDTTNVSGLLNQFWGAMRSRHVLFTDKMWMQASRPPKKAVKPVRPTDKLEGIYVQVSDTGVMRISASALADWCRQAKKSQHIFVQALMDKYGMRTTVGMIGSGSDHAQGKEYLYELDLNRCPDLDFRGDK